MIAPRSVAYALAGVSQAFAAGHQAGRSGALAETGTVLATIGERLADEATAMFLDGLDRSDGCFADDEERAEIAGQARAWFFSRFVEAVGEEAAAV